MSDYTPTLEDAKRTFAYIQGGLDHDEGYKPFYQVHEEAFDRMIAEVERTAAARALEEVAVEIGALVSEYTATAERLSEGKEWADSNRYFGYASGSNRASAIVRARAADIRERNTND